MRACCQYTRRRPERTHGGVLNLHTELFPACQASPHTTHTHHHTTPHAPPHEKGLFLSVYVDDIKLAGKKQNLDPMWKVLNKEVDLGEPTSFLDHVFLGCTQRQCEVSQDIVDNYRTMFESRIFAGGVEKLPFPQNIRISSWSYDMVGHAKKCVERYCELANKTTQQLYKVSTPCTGDHHFKEEELKSVGEMTKVCSQIVLKC